MYINYTITQILTILNGGNVLNDVLVVVLRIGEFSFFYDSFSLLNLQLFHVKDVIKT